MNMSYCRFENTCKDLQDCYNHFIDTDLSESEKEARKELFDLCSRILEEYAERNKINRLL